MSRSYQPPDEPARSTGPLVCCRCERLGLCACPHVPRLDVRPALRGSARRSAESFSRSCLVLGVILLALMVVLVLLGEVHR